MKKNNLSIHLKKALVFLLVAVTVFTIIPINSFAASKAPSFNKKEYFSWYYNPCGWSYTFANSKTTDKFISVTSSNPKVATARKEKCSGYPTVFLKPQKAGTTKITAKIKRGQKIYTTTAKVTFLNFTNPFKSVKIGNKEYVNAIKTAKTPWIGVPMSGKQKITVKTLSDWKHIDTTIRLKDSRMLDYTKGQKVELSNVVEIGIVLKNKKIKNSQLTIWLDKK